MAHGGREESRARPPAARPARGPCARGDRPGPRCRSREGRGRARGGPRRRHRGRPPEARLHGLPSGARARGARRADAAPARRPHDRRDRAGLPRARGHGRPADRPREEIARRRARPVRGPARGGPHRAPLLGPRGPVPHLQRGLRGDGGRGLDASAALRGGAAARTDPRDRSRRRSPRSTASSP